MQTYLVLHGYHQSADVISKKIKDLLPKNSTLIIPNGPLIVEDGMRGWFPLSKINLETGMVTLDQNDIAVILAHDFEVTKFDAIIAFSQGCLAAVTLLSTGKIFAPKLLLFSPIPNPVEFPYTLTGGVRSRVYIGMKDDLVAPDHSRAFANILGDNVVVVEHRWGHVIPSTGHYKQEYATFLNS